MPERCPSCGAPAQADARFCTECGAGIDPGVRAAAPPSGAAPPPLPRLDLPPFPGLPAAQPEIVLEVETSRRHVQDHASQLRFQATSMAEAALEVSLRVALLGRGRFVEQVEGEEEQRSRFEKRGEQHIFSFPFRGLIPGELPIDRLRMTVVRSGEPGRPAVYELPDRSLFVNISDPKLEEGGPGISISGGIHLNFPQLNEMYGSDIRNLLNLDVSKGAAARSQETGWQAIGLRRVEGPGLEDEDDAVGAIRLSLPGGVPLEMVRIPRAPIGEGSCFMGKHPVTQVQYQALMKGNPSRFSGADHPVDSVSWNDAREFCRKLRSHLLGSPNAIEPKLSVGDVRLPTEALWEHACRAGASTSFSFGEDRALLSEHGWFEKNSGRRTHTVGGLKPNPWGLHDMHGNVWEWCEDPYSTEPGAADSRRALRGGSWSYPAAQCRSSSRHGASPDDRTPNYGFRIVFIALPASARGRPST